MNNKLDVICDFFQSNIAINRKILSELAVHEPRTFHVSIKV